MKLSQVWEEYEKDKRLEGYSRTTIEQYRLYSNLFIRWLGDKPIQDVTDKLMKEYLLKDIDRLKKSSINSRMKYFKSVWKWAHENDFINKNVATKVKDIKEEQRAPKHFDYKSIEIIRMNCKTTIERALLEFLFSTGCRVSEVRDVDLDSIDWTNNSVRIIGKGNKEREVYFDTTTNVWLSKYVNEREDKESPLFVTERTFKREDGTKSPRRVSNDQIRWILKRLSKRSGVEEIYPHKFRHSYAMHLLNKGAPLEVIQTFLGHADLKTTRIYAEHSNKMRRDLYNKYF